MTRSSIILHSRDGKLSEQLRAYWSAQADVRQTDTPNRLWLLICQLGPCVVAVDLRQRDSDGLVAELGRRFPECVIVALGEEDSDPLVAAERAGVFDTEAVNGGSRRLAAMGRRALAYLESRRQVRMLSDMPAAMAVAQPVLGLPQPESRSLLLPLRDLSRAFRHFQRLDRLYEYLVEGIASTLKLSRVGLFVGGARPGEFTLRCGVRCLPEVRELLYVETDPLVQWMAMQGHLISRSVLDHVLPAESRYMLRQALAAMGAEVIMPIHANGGFHGWLFLGHRASGYPFEPQDLDDLSLLAEHLSTVIENALLYRETTVQKMLADTLLDTIPTGIVAVDHDQRITRLNDAATRILALMPEQLMPLQPIDDVHVRIGHLLRQALHGRKASVGPEEWMETHTHRLISVEARRLVDGESCVGAVAFIQDITRERLLKTRQDELERTRFWADLAASMSHEIRNPLVTIKTFAQLLPETFDDAEFRDRFSELVPAEVDRLDGIVNQIQEFANPPELRFGPCDIEDVLKGSIDDVKAVAASAKVAVKPTIPPRCPQPMGDSKLLRAAFAHVLRNALEAMPGAASPEVSVDVSGLRDPDQGESLVICIRDNGRGLTDEHLAKAFSPFFTTKTQGLGLGLPIARRTILDHGGWLQIEPLSSGTQVIISLPVNRSGTP